MQTLLFLILLLALATGSEAVSKSSNSFQGSCLRLGQSPFSNYNYNGKKRRDVTDEDDKPVSRNIVGGTALPERSWPFLVAILSRLDGEDFSLSCGGTLIHPQYVLTSAHCFTDENEQTKAWRYLDASQFSVLLGQYDVVQRTNPNAVTMRVVSYRVHPGFLGNNKVEIGNDIAIAKLEQPVAYSDWINAACLPDSSSALPANISCLVGGWGSKKKDGSGASSYPRVAKLSATATRTCYDVVKIPSEARDGRLFCAGDPTGVQDSCSGDSGGPTFCQVGTNGDWDFSGVVSFGGEDCADSQLPGAYTTVTRYIDWIQSVVAPVDSQTVLLAGGNLCRQSAMPAILAMTILYCVF